MTHSEPRWADLTILVTGGAGFLGMHVARALLNRGARVVLQGAVRKRAALLDAVLAAPNAQLLQYELNTREQARAFTSQLGAVDYVVHLSLHVPSPSCGADPLAAYRATNLEPFVVLLEGLPRNVRGVCLASSISVYGVGDGVPLREDQPLHGDSPYALTKRAMEMAVIDYGRRHGRPVTVLRYTTLYGPGEYSSPRAIPTFIRSSLMGQRPVIYGDGGDVHDYLYVQDAAEGTCQALAALARSPGIYNLGSGSGRSTRDIAETVQRLMNVPGLPEYVPTRGPRRCVIADITQARNQLGFHPRTQLEIGIRAEIEDQRTYLLKSQQAPGAGPPRMETCA